MFANKQEPPSEKVLPVLPAKLTDDQIKAHVMQRLKTHIKVHRIRLADFFKDFDKLKSYSIRREDFMRVFGYYGISVTRKEQEVIANHYCDHQKIGFCKWKAFNDELEGTLNLESNPGHVHQVDEESSPFMIQNNLTELEEGILARTLQNIRDHLKIRRVNIKQSFSDFDRLCSSMGYVTKSQFRQGFTGMKYEVTPEEFEIICKKWTRGVTKETAQGEQYIEDLAQCICYSLFVQEVENGNTNQKTKLIKTHSEKTETKPEQTHETLINKLMMKIKIKVKTERIRVLDFMKDFDPLRRGKISADKFKRAIKVLFSELTDNDLCVLTREFASKADPNDVSYLEFGDLVEAVFTRKDLHKNPTAEPEKVRYYSNGWECGPFAVELSNEEQQTLDAAVKRLQSRIESQRLDALSYMEDYDFANKGKHT
jgi:hypothetical protein